MHFSETFRLKSQKRKLNKMRTKNGGKSNQRISRLRLAEISQSRRGEETVRAIRGRRRGFEATTVISKGTGTIDSHK